MVVERQDGKVLRQVGRHHVGMVDAALVVRGRIVAHRDVDVDVGVGNDMVAGHDVAPRDEEAGALDNLGIQESSKI